MLNAKLINDLINPGNTKIIPGLERMHKILDILGNPQHKYQVIHITGTNGKGSTAAFLESALVSCGYKVGKFTSPHISKINECITINHKEISDTELETCYFKIKELITVHNIELSPFEFLTTIMFEYFATQAIDWLILEVGMGGLNDATNMVNSKYSIITNVELEHCMWLGNTISEIAIEKSGIIKSGLAIFADNKVEVVEIISNKTSNYINVLSQYKFSIDLDLESFRTLLNVDDKLYSLSLFGKFQAYNFLCAYAVFKDMGIADKHIKYAAENTMWPYRLMVLEKNPLVVVDATHNSAGAKSLYDSLLGIYNPNDVVVVTSILRDKDIKAMLKYFAKLATSVIYTSIDNNPRGLKASDMVNIGIGIFSNELCIDKPIDAIAKAKQMGKKAIIVTGSLYLLA
jgi:dihydrofolate synthase/folylpolyglutamate synthase